MKWILIAISAMTFSTLGTLRTFAQAPQKSFFTVDEEALIDHASEMQKTGRDAEMLSDLNHAVKLIEVRLGQKDVRLLLVYNKVAITLGLSHPVEADPYFAKALALGQSLSTGKKEDQKALLKLYTSYAQCKLREDQYPQAKDLYDRAIDADYNEAVSVMFNMAQDFRSAGDYVRSEWLFRYLLAQVDELAATLGDDTDGESKASIANIRASLRNQLAILLMHRGDTEEALKLFEAALTEAETAYGKTNPSLQPFLYNLADLHQKRGEYKEAEPYFRRALANAEAHPDNKDEIATNSSNLGLLYLHMDRNREAILLLERALKLRREGPSNLNLAVDLVNIASAYGQTHQPELAERRYDEAVKIARERIDEDRRGYMVLGEAATYYLEKGRKADADDLFALAADRNEKGSTALDPELADWLFAVSLQYLENGDCRRAVSYAKRGGRVRDLNVSLLMTAGTQDQRQRYLEQSEVETHVAVSLHQHCAATDPGVARLGYQAVLSRKGRSAEAFADQLAVMRQRAEPNEKALLQEYAQIAAEMGSQRSSAMAEKASKLEIEISETCLRRPV